VRRFVRVFRHPSGHVVGTSADTARLPPKPACAHTGAMTAPDAPPTAVESATFGIAAHEVWAYRLHFAYLPDHKPDLSGVERVTEGEGAGGTSGSGARYLFTLSDPRRPNGAQPVEL
jgi:hypothetical protein